MHPRSLVGDQTRTRALTRRGYGGTVAQQLFPQRARMLASRRLITLVIGVHLRSKGSNRAHERLDDTPPSHAFETCAPRSSRSSRTSCRCDGARTRLRSFSLPRARHKHRGCEATRAGGMPTRDDRMRWPHARTGAMRSVRCRATRAVARSADKRNKGRLWSLPLANKKKPSEAFADDALRA